MAELTQRPNFEKYQYGALAELLASSEESGRYAPGALEVLAGAKGLNLGEEALGFIRGTQASEDGIKTAIQIYAGKFKEKRGEYKPAELAAGWYANVLNSIDKGDKDKIVAKLGMYDETLGAIQKKVKKARLVVSASKDKDLKEEYTPEQIVQSEETLKKYGTALQIIEALDRYTFENLRPEAVNTTFKQELKGLASKV